MKKLTSVIAIYCFLQIYLSAQSIVGPANTHTAALSDTIQQYIHTITTDNAFNDTDFPCFNDLMTDGNHYYQVVSFTVPFTRQYTFVLNNISWTGGTLGAIYKAHFNEIDLCQHLQHVGWINEASGGGLANNGEPILRTKLEAGVTYYLLTAAREPNQAGAFTWNIFHEDDALLAFDDGMGFTSGVINQTFKLFSFDVDKISNQPAVGTFRVDDQGNLSQVSSLEWSNILQKTGYARVDGCGGSGIFTFEVSDVIESFGSGNGKLIRRTFTLIDQDQGGCMVANLMPVEQEITLDDPTLSDFIAPSSLQFLDEATGYAKTNDGVPLPETSGYPFIPSPFNFKGFESNLGLLHFSYTDTEMNPPVGDIRHKREMVLFDFNNPGSFVQFDQIIDQRTAPPFMNERTGQAYTGINDAMRNAQSGDRIMIFTPTIDEPEIIFDDTTPDVLSFVGEGDPVEPKAWYSKFVIGKGATSLLTIWEGDHNLWGDIFDAVEEEGQVTFVVYNNLEINGQIGNFGPNGFISTLPGGKLIVHDNNLNFIPIGFGDTGQNPAQYTPLKMSTAGTNLTVEISALGNDQNEPLETNFLNSKPVLRSRTRVNNVWDIRVLDENGNSLNEPINIDFFYPTALKNNTSDIENPVVAHNKNGTVEFHLGTPVTGITLNNRLEVANLNFNKVSIQNVVTGSPFAIIGFTGCGQGKVRICNFPPEFEGKAENRCIPIAELPQYLESGAYEGPCVDEMLIPCPSCGDFPWDGKKGNK